MMMWLLDTLDSIDKFPPTKFAIYLKGGTCVQHYLPLERQRFSMDLDFSANFVENYEIPRKAAMVKEYLNSLNGRLSSDGWTTDHGTLRIPEKPTEFSFISFCGRIFQPIKCPKSVNKVLNIEGAAYIKTEFFLHDRDPEYKRQKLSLVFANYATTGVSFNLASKTRLLADKIIALSGEGYGAREENKDIIDLKELSALQGIELTSVRKMITSWGESHLGKDGNPQPIDPPVKIIHAAHQMASTKSTITDQALAEMTGLLYARGRPGFNLTKDQWKAMCLEVAEFLSSKVLPLFDGTR
jgi:hypothetical protein